MTRSRTEEMDVFVAVAAAESFSEASRRLGLSPSAVSKLVKKLEERLGVRLVTRSTHGLALTVEGSRYASACRRILASIDEAEADVCGNRAALSGTLRVSSSGPLAFHVVAPMLPSFCEKYPKLALEFLVSDNLIDLIEERADLALRIGPLRDSTMKVRRLGRTKIVHVAAPTYIKRFSAPMRAEDLADHSVLGFPLDGHRDRSDGLLPNLATDSGELLRHFALNGLGIARLAHFHVADDLAKGDLAKVLTENETSSFQDVSAVFPSHRQPAPRIAVFIEHAISTLRSIF